jgi:hypothetical protein
MNVGNRGMRVKLDCRPLPGLEAHMIRFTILVVAIAATAGCQTAQLQHGTLQQAKSVNDLFYAQVMANIATLAEHQETFPYFSLPQTGQNTVQYSVTLGATPEWDLVTSSTRLLGAFAFSKQGASLSGSDTNIEMWNSAPSLVPNKILLMKYAYECAGGNQLHRHELEQVLDYEFKYFERKKEEQLNPPDRKKKREELQTAIAKIDRVDLPHLEDLQTLSLSKIEGLKTSDSQKYAESVANIKDDFRQRKMVLDVQKANYEQQLKALDLQPPGSSLTEFGFPYSTFLKSNWFEVGTRKQVPKNACFVGHCGKTYAWVRPGEEQALAEFTMVILNILTFEAPDREKRQQSPPGISGKVSK